MSPVLHSRRALVADGHLTRLAEQGQPLLGVELAKRLRSSLLLLLLLLQSEEIVRTVRVREGVVAGKPHGHQRVVRCAPLPLVGPVAKLAEVAGADLAAAGRRLVVRAKVTWRRRERGGGSSGRCAPQLLEVLHVEVPRQPLHAVARRRALVHAYRAVDGCLRVGGAIRLGARRRRFLLKARSVQAAGAERVEARQDACIAILLQAERATEVLGSRGGSRHRHWGGGARG